MKSFSQENVCNQSEGKYTYGDAIHAPRDYIRGKPRLHTNPSDWIKIKHLLKQVLYFLEQGTGIEPASEAWEAPIIADILTLHGYYYTQVWREMQGENA